MLGGRTWWGCVARAEPGHVQVARARARRPARELYTGFLACAREPRNAPPPNSGHALSGMLLAPCQCLWLRNRWSGCGATPNAAWPAVIRKNRPARRGLWVTVVRRGCAPALLPSRSLPRHSWHVNTVLLCPGKCRAGGWRLWRGWAWGSDQNHVDQSAPHFARRSRLCLAHVSPASYTPPTPLQRCTTLLSSCIKRGWRLDCVLMAKFCGNGHAFCDRCGYQTMLLALVPHASPCLHRLCTPPPPPTAPPVYTRTYKCMIRS